MAKIRYHMPGFIDNGQPPSDSPAEFETLEDLLALSRVSSWAQSGAEFSLSPHGKELLLMATMPDKTFWVVGYLTRGLGLNLPRWEEPNRKHDK